jgi:hypothetical protein
MEQALPRDRAALRAEPKNPAYREAYRTHTAIMAEVFGSLSDHAGAADAADELVRFGYEPAEDAYTASWIIARCVGLAEDDRRLSKIDLEVLKKSYSDRTMAHLHSAVRHGFKDVARVKKEKAYQPLRPRDDFRKLLGDLEAAPPRR